MIDVDLARLDAVVARIAHDLGWGVEPHRLRIEQRAGEGCGVMALDPRRDVDQQRETGRVAFGKAVFAETFDLVEAARREVWIIPARHHAADHLLLELADGAAPAERRHRLAQLVHLGIGKLRRLHGDAHRLLLKQRHAFGLRQNAMQLVGVAVRGIGRGIGLRFQPRATAQIRMHHVALNGARSHDRHLDDEVVEHARTQARQHVHLRPALDLENADRVGPAEHVVNEGIVARHGGERQPAAVMGGDQIERFADAGEHAERQNVDLHEAECRQIVFVPLDEGAVRHRRVAHGHNLDERPARQHETADVL